MIAMLYHIQLNNEHNQMTSFNLAVCIAPSCLWNCKLQSPEKDAKKVSAHARFIIARLLSYLLSAWVSAEVIIVIAL